MKSAAVKSAVDMPLLSEPAKEKDKEVAGQEGKQPKSNKFKKSISRAVVCRFDIEMFVFSLGVNRVSS